MTLEQFSNLIGKSKTFRWCGMTMRGSIQSYSYENSKFCGPIFKGEIRGEKGYQRIMLYCMADLHDLKVIGD